MLAFVGPVRNEPMMKGYGLGTVNINLGALTPQWENVQAYGHLGSQFGCARDWKVAGTVLSRPCLAGAQCATIR